LGKGGKKAGSGEGKKERGKVVTSNSLPFFPLYIAKEMKKKKKKKKNGGQIISFVASGASI